MKILLIGSLSNYAIERYYLKYFSEVAGVDATLYKAQNIFLDYYQKKIFNKIFFRLGYKKIYKKINAGLKNEIDNYKPDILFVFKGMEIFPQTLQWAINEGIKIVNYNPDNPFIFSGRGSGNQNISDSVPLYNIHFTYNLQTKNELEKRYTMPVYWLPFGFDISEDIYVNASSLTEILKVCFVGNPDKKRAHFLTYLALNKIKIDVYGTDWGRFVNHPNITLLAPVHDDELWLTLRKYRVQLNPLRMHNLDSHGMRSFEVPAIGGILLAPRTQEHVQFFIEDKEAFFYDNYDEAITKINYILSLQKNKADAIRHASRTKSIKDKYDYKSRSEFVVKILKENFDIEKV